MASPMHGRPPPPPHHHHLMYPPPQMHPPPYPMQNIEKPTHSDVLCGRGVTTNRHKGNENFRSLVGCNKELYVTSTKKQKMRISRSIVEAVRSLSPPGRFLEKSQETGTWFDIGDKKAIEKTSQALRDGAASLRKQLSADLSDPDFLKAVFDADATDANPKASSSKPPKPTSSKKEKKEDKATKKPPAKGKGHRRTKSNPTVGTRNRGKSLVIKRQMSQDGPPSPQYYGASSFVRPGPHSPRLPPMMEPSMAYHRGPGHSYSLPSSPVAQNDYHDPRHHAFHGPPSRSGSFEYGPEHYERPPPRHFSPHPPPPAYHGPPSPRYGHSPRPAAPPYRPPISPRWSPHTAFNREGPSLSPHPYLYPSEIRSTPPEHRPPVSLRPREHYPPRSPSPSNRNGGSLAVPFLGGERPMGPPPPMPHCPPHGCPLPPHGPPPGPPPGPPLGHPGPPPPGAIPYRLPISPTRYPSSPHSSYGPPTPGSPVIPRDFTPPHYHRRRPMSPPAFSTSAREHSAPAAMEIESREYEPRPPLAPRSNEKSAETKRPTSTDSKPPRPEKPESSTRIQVSSPTEKKSETPPAIEVVLVDKKTNESPSAVAEIMQSKPTEEDRLKLPAGGLEDAEYPSDEEPNPAQDDDISWSPLPVDHPVGPNMLMEVPADLLYLPISPCSPHDENSEGSI